MSNALLLKKAMKALDLSGVTLARSLTKYRDDGRVTAPETISRWLNSTNNVEPAVLAWLEELLRIKATQSSKASITWSEDKQNLVIGIVTPKGGVGTSTLAMNLFVMAHKNFKTNTQLIQVDKDKPDRYIQRTLQGLELKARALSVNEIVSLPIKNREIIILDIHRYIALDAREEYENSELSKLEAVMDIILSPANFGSESELWNHSEFLKPKEIKDKICFIHHPRSLYLDFEITPVLQKLEVTIDHFYPNVMPHALDGDDILPDNIHSDWKNKDQEYYHYELFEYILNKFECATCSTYELKRKLKDMSLIELITYFEEK